GATALFVVVLPYLFFDHVHYVDPAGIAMLGIWLAMLDTLTVWSRSDSPTLAPDSQGSRHDFIA
ncbi:MAG: hypothetical protein QGD91_10080, partial [Actinomycetota bacterium]|nr:hypothetical protein [Actinomycetota bacterium]